MNPYRLAALVVLPFYLLAGYYELVFLGHPQSWVFWLVGLILLFVAALLLRNARAEEKDEEETAPELVRELTPAADRPKDPFWPTGPETFCPRCGGAVLVGATACEHCGAQLSNVSGAPPSS